MKVRLVAAIAGLAILLAASGSGGTAAEPQAPAYGIVGSVAGAQTVGRIDPVTLKPLAGGLPLAKDLSFGGRSPDGRSAVFFDYRRPSLRVVDLEGLKNRGDVVLAPAGWRARAAAWLTADRVAVVIQRMRGSYSQIVDRREVVIVDPFARRVLSRRPLAVATALTASASGGDKLVLLLGRGDARTRTVRVVVVDSSGAVRTITVDLGAPKGLRLPALAVEPSGLRAFVFAAGAPVFEIDLDTLKVIPHALTGAGAVVTDALVGSRQALLLDGGILAVTGHNTRRERGIEISDPAGLAFIDTSTWQARLIDRDVSGASVSGDTLVGYSFRIERVKRDGRPAQKVTGIGLRAYAPDGTRRWQRYANQPLTAYAFRQSALVYRQAIALGSGSSFVIDLANGRQIRANSATQTHVWLLPDVPSARPIRAPAAATAEALQVEGGGDEFRGTVQREVTRAVAVLVDGSERELTIEAGGVTYRAGTPEERARTVQAFAGDQLVAAISMPVTCGGSAGPCAPAAAHDTLPTYAFVGELPSGRATLVQVDPRTLAPVGRGLRLGELFVPSFARSPDGAEVALAVAGKPLVRIVELASLTIIRTLRVGAAGDEARALAWLDNDRLAVVTQRMSRPTRRYVRDRAVVTIDPTSGRVVARSPVTNKLAIGGVGIGAGRLVLLLRSSDNKGSTVGLAVVDATGTVRTRELEVGKTRGVLNATALAVEPSGKRAFVLGWAIQRTTPPVIEVDLDTLKTTNRLVSVKHTGPLAPAMISTLRVGPAGDGLVIAFGAIGAQGSSEGMLRPAAGIFVMDTRSWTAKLLDPRASYFKVQERRVITYGPNSAPTGAQPTQHGSGVSVYELPTRKLFHLYASRPFQRIELADDYGHVLLGDQRTKRLVFDTNAGKPLGMLPAMREPIQVLPAVLPAAVRRPAAATTSAAPTAALRQSDPFSRVSNRGTRVKPQASRPGEREMTPRDLFLLRQDEGRAVYRIGGLKPGHGTCFGSGPGNDIGRLGGIVCGQDFPSRRNPLQNMSVMQTRREGKMPQLYRLEGVAADAITEIGLMDVRGKVIERVPVRDNVYVLARPPAAAAGELVAYDAQGKVIFRTDQRQQRPAAPAPAPNPRRLTGFRLKITLPKGWSGEIRRSTAGRGRTLLLAGNRLPARNPQSVSLALTERDPRARPAFQRIAELPQLRPADVRPSLSGHGRAQRSFTFQGRQFSLQLDFGRPRPTPAQLEQINRALATLYVGAIAVAPTAAPPGTPLQRGSDDGVSVDVYRSGIVAFRFDRTSRLYRQLQGKQPSVACLTFDSVRPWETNEAWFSNRKLAETMQFTFTDAARPQPPYATVDPATEAKPPFDGCLVSGSYGRRWNDPRGQHSPAEIAFTAAGKRFFDERAVARDLALFIRSPKLPAARRSLKQGGTAPAASALTRGLPARVVALVERGGLPGTGEIGVWSDRRDTIEVSARSSAGKRLFIELRGGRIAQHNLEGLAFVF